MTVPELQVCKESDILCGDGAGPNYHFAEGTHAGEIQAFFEAQQDAYMQPGSAGAFIWSLKNDVANDVWSFEGSLRNGWIGAGFDVPTSTP